MKLKFSLNSYNFSNKNDAFSVKMTVKFLKDQGKKANSRNREISCSCEDSNCRTIEYS